MDRRSRRSNLTGAGAHLPTAGNWSPSHPSTAAMVAVTPGWTLAH